MEDSSITAGREIDLQIAERVFGRDRQTARVDPMNRNGEPQYHWGYPHGHDFAPFYSTDIAAAMLILDRSDGLWELSRYPEAEDDDDPASKMDTRYCCRLRFDDRLGHAIADTAAEAICQAALKAWED